MKNLNHDLKILQNCLLTHNYVENCNIIAKQKKVAYFEKIVFSTFQYATKEMQWLSCTGGNFSVRSSLLAEAGMFDENYGRIWGGEDIELGYRFHKIGASFYYSESAYNYHLDHYRCDFENAIKYSCIYFYKKHPDTIIRNLSKLLLGEIDTIEDYLTESNAPSGAVPDLYASH